jgi:hypothetical protein
MWGYFVWNTPLGGDIFVGILHKVEMFSCGIHYIMWICNIQWNVNLKKLFS